MFEDDDEDELGAAPVFTGLHRPKLTWPGLDGRFLIAAFILFLVGAVSGYGMKNLGSVGVFTIIFFALGIFSIALGLLLGRFAPYALDELGQYLMLRIERWSFVASDDAGSTFKGVGKWKS